MNKEELTTLPMPQGTSHCSCLEHCFLFAGAVWWVQRSQKTLPSEVNSLLGGQARALSPGSTTVPLSPT